MKKFFQANIFIITIITLGIFFRLYHFESLLSFGHDQDLLSWIAKDIIADHHLRLIGQETSISGIFIGPLFYYLMAFFYSLFQMNPNAAIIPLTIISALTIYSLYFVFSKFFNKTTGLIASFFYSVSLGIVFLDRWMVPTQATILWTTWYFYTLFSILRKNFRILPLLAVLLGLIWHIHIAFIPLLVLLPVAFFLSKSKTSELRQQISLKLLIVSITAFLVLVSPLVFFEVRHNFQQTKSFTRSFSEERGEVSGLQRIVKISAVSAVSSSKMFLLDRPNPDSYLLLEILIPLAILISVIYLTYQRIFLKEQTIIIASWIAVFLLSQIISKRVVTEYYFNNFYVLYLLLISSLLAKFSQHFISKAFIFLFLLGFVLINFYSLSRLPIAAEGYLVRERAVSFINNDAKAHQYRCAAINYIGQPGSLTGFRYLYWLKGLNIITPGNDVPVYSLVNPWNISEKEVQGIFGYYGVIPPRRGNYDFQSICDNSARQILPLWGFTN